MTSSLVIAYDCLYPYTRGGGERQYRAFADAAAAAGRDVTYLTARQWDGPAPSTTAFSVNAVTGPLRLYDENGVRRTAAAIRFAWGLFRELRRRRHEVGQVLVSGLPVFNVFAARAALIGTRVPLAVDYLEVWHRAQWTRYAGTAIGTLAWMAQRLAIACTPIATCHSQLSATRLRKEGFRGRLLVSPGLIDSDSLSGTEPTAAAVPPFIVYAGRHIADKRVEAIPDAVAFARKTIPELRAVVLGEGPSRPEVEAAVERVGGEDWIDLPGFVDELELERTRSRAACLVNPSRREGYGLVVVEAAASGTPVVLVDDDDNASTELLDEGVNGFIASSASAEDLGAAIVSAVTAGQALRTSTRAWYEDALRTRTISSTVTAILSTLDEAEQPSGRDRRRTPQEGSK